jgi:4-alpha-glucanotransferase
MTLIFNIEYRTNWGEEVRVLGNIPELGNSNPVQALALHTIDGIHWTAEVNIKQPKSGKVQYSYHIYYGGNVVRSEWNYLPRTLYVSGASKKTYRIEDCWKNIPEQQYFYTSAFTESLLAHNKRSAAPKSKNQSILFKAYAPCVDNDHCLAICGNQPALGDWDITKCILMSDANFPEWQADVDATTLTYPIEYKFVLYNKTSRSVVAWENNPNRYIADPQMGENETLAIGD